MLDKPCSTSPLGREVMASGLTPFPGHFVPTAFLGVTVLADQQLSIHITSTTPPRAGLSLLLFPAIKSNILESWCNHTVIQGREEIPTRRFSSFLHRPQAAPTTRGLAQTPDHTQLWMGVEGQGSSPTVRSTSHGAHQPVSSSPHHLTEIRLPPLAWWKV